MQRVEYYQIGGFRANLRENSSNALADRLLPFHQAEGEFVLGIRPNGASYLLLPVRLFESHRLGRPYGKPWRAEAFESLSPIQFANKRDLIAKLKMLESNKKSSDGPRDRSKANTEYAAGGEGKTDAGVARASFEHQRVFYRLCQDTLAYPQRYALSKARWFRDVRIYSFAFNLWAADTRPLEERQKDPLVLDLGWTEFDAPTDSADLKAVSTTHLTVEENRILFNRGRTRLALPDITQEMPRASVGRLLQELFAPDCNGERKPPKLLLVHNEAATRHVLRSFGVDPEALHWVQGIKDLLYCPFPERGYEGATYPSGRDEKRTYAREPPDRSHKSYRDRSRSPRRRPEDERHLRCRSPPSRVDWPSVYVVDVRQMYHYLMQAHSSNDTLPSIAKALDVRDTAMARGEDDQVIYQDIDPKHLCAGRESRLNGYMWEEMARQESIDEQRARRRGDALEEPVESVSGLITAISADNGDVDPNDSIQPMAHSAPASRTAARSAALYDSEEEDDY